MNQLNSLNIEQPQTLTTYLQSQGHIDLNEQPKLTQLSGGVSNRTMLVERENGEAWVVKQALEKLRVPVDWFSSPSRIHREALGLKYVATLTSPNRVPELLFEDRMNHIIAMQAVPQPHANWKQLLLKGEVHLSHVHQFAQLLGEIHRKSFANQAEFRQIFADRTFFESLRLEPYYAYTATKVPEAAAFLHTLIQETRRHQLTLVHGDYSPKNILVYRDSLILLDYEVCHCGDPSFDLGFSLTHFLSKAHHLPHKRGDFVTAAQTYWQVYQQTLGDVSWLEDLNFRVVNNTLACLLARVIGRSPLEYFSETEQKKQQEVVIALIKSQLRTATDLIENFVERL